MANGKKNPRISTSFSITQEMDELIDAYCELYDQSRSDIAMRAFRIFFAVEAAQRPSFVKECKRMTEESLSKN